ncbi:MAG: hypothetical protein HQK66_08995 [Desulfamplus sp.]|nr:hypothetical protein [Desulfamplus sp.]
MKNPLFSKINHRLSTTGLGYLLYTLFIFTVPSLFCFPYMDNSLWASQAGMEEIQKVAIVPFKINSGNDIGYARDGICRMLSSRIAWKNRIVVASSMEMDAVMENMGGQGTVQEIASLTKAHYVIQGSLTEFAGAFSLDASVFDSVGETSRRFFFQGDTLERLISGVEIIAAQINMAVFQRSTSALALLQQEDRQKPKISLHDSPERLIHEMGIHDRKAKIPFWKIWRDGEGAKSSPKEQEQDEEIKIQDSLLIDIEMDKDEKKPFWKFW